MPTNYKKQVDQLLKKNGIDSTKRSRRETLQLLDSASRKKLVNIYNGCVLERGKSRQGKLCPDGYCTAKVGSAVTRTRYPSAYANINGSRVCKGSNCNLGQTITSVESGKKCNKIADADYVKGLDSTPQKSSTLRRWLQQEKWRNLCQRNPRFKPDRDPCHEKYEPCGTGQGLENPDQYPYCRPFYKADGTTMITAPELTDREIVTMCKLKRQHQRKNKPDKVVNIPKSIQQRIRDSKVDHSIPDPPDKYRRASCREYQRTLRKNRGEDTSPKKTPSKKISDKLRNAIRGKTRRDGGLNKGDLLRELTQVSNVTNLAKYSRKKLERVAAEMFKIAVQPSKKVHTNTKKSRRSSQPSSPDHYLGEYTKVFHPIQKDGFYTVTDSDKPKKKKMVKVRDRDGDEQWVHFGHSDYGDMTIHRDPTRQSNYCKRSGGIKCKGKKCDQTSPNFWSRQALWDCEGGKKSNICQSLTDRIARKQLHC